MPVSVVGVKISKTGNYTILFTVSYTVFSLNVFLFTVTALLSYKVMFFV
ncbi:hypothetical protein YPPY11_2642 [Yersinia pestis PY-11]|nr:hypothetical protein YPPY11_2642 [Yersinia pestis PY-11]EIR49012.1 hypothetical protein YPPY14_2495 [Yersinia pestis PY-14]